MSTGCAFSAVTSHVNKSLLEMKDRADSLLAVDKKTTQTVHFRGTGLLKTINHETAIALAREGLEVVLVMDVSAGEDLANKRLREFFQLMTSGISIWNLDFVVACHRRQKKHLLDLWNHNSPVVKISIC